MIKITIYHEATKTTRSDKEMTYQEALVDLVARCSGLTEVIFVGYGGLIQLYTCDHDGETVCVSYFELEGEGFFFLLEWAAKHYALSTHKCSDAVREELRAEFREQYEKFQKIST